MGITGIGTDIVEVERIHDLVGKWNGRFLHRVFCESELEYCLNAKNASERLAGRFAAKEAVIKSLGRSVPWKAIKVVSTEVGRPIVHLRSSPGLEEQDNSVIELSISHTKQYATATAICVKKD